MIELNSFTKNYGNKIILKDINIKIEDKKIFLLYVMIVHCTITIILYVELGAMIARIIKKK